MFARWPAVLVLGFVGLLPLSTAARSEDKPVYELRTYTTAPEKLAVLVERFGKHNLPLFEKHGIKLVGAWTPEKPDDRGDRLVYLVWFPSRQAAESAWRAFSADPQWQAIFGKEKEEHGTVVTKVERVFLAPTDYSPTPGGLDGAHLYELRTYTASPGKLDALNRRFREHTLGLFSKHGMTNVVYMVPTDEDQGAEDTLVYFLAHADRASADASWKGFRDDPEWQKVREASEADGTRLAAKVESVYLKPTAFSPLK